MARESKRKRDERRFGRPERLADILSSDDWRTPGYCDGVANSPELRTAFEGMVADVKESAKSAKMLVADNVGEYFYAQNSKENWEFSEDFPSVLPPFKETLVEFRRPSRILSEGKVLPASAMPDRWGWLLWTESREEAIARVGADAAEGNAKAFLEQQLNELYGLIDRDSIAAIGGNLSRIKELGEREQTFVAFGLQYRELLRGRSIWDHIPQDAAWFVSGTLIMVSSDVPILAATMQMVLRADGRVIEHPSYGILGGNLVDAGTATGARDSYHALLFPVGLALSLLHCKNVTIQDVEPDRELNRERKKAGLKPFVRYHTINIEPMKKVLRTEGNVEANGLKKALHIVRGHFTHYTEEKPLFGRPGLFGTFWTPSHARGSIDSGLIHGDYNVKAPKPGGARS